MGLTTTSFGTSRTKLTWYKARIEGNKKRRPPTVVSCGVGGAVFFLRQMVGNEVKMASVEKDEYSRLVA